MGWSVYVRKIKIVADLASCVECGWEGTLTLESEVAEKEAEAHRKMHEWKNINELSEGENYEEGI